MAFNQAGPLTRTVHSQTRLESIGSVFAQFQLARQPLLDRPFMQRRTAEGAVRAPQAQVCEATLSAKPYKQALTAKYRMQTQS